MIDVRFRAIPTWTYPTTSNRRSRWTFQASWQSTLHLLDRELYHLGATDVVIECGMTPRDIRMDGWPRGDARTPSHPGIALHFDTREHGHLRYATDVFDHWEANVRAIALGLEALRKIDRYGITRGGEQYRGFGELPSGIAMPAARMSVEDAAQFLIEATEGTGAIYDPDDLIDGPFLADAYRAATKRLHPDTGGSVAEFQKLQEAKAVLDEYGRQR